MKKIIALLLVAASLLSLAACKVNGGEPETTVNPLDAANEFASRQAEVEAEYSRKAAEKAAEEAEVQQEIDEYIAKVGKTKKKTQLVIETVNWSLGKKYQKFEFNKKGEFKSETKYVFYDSLENYFSNLEIEKNRKVARVVDKDKDMKMIVVNNPAYDGLPFDEMYKFYTSEDAKKLGYKVVE